MRIGNFLREIFGFNEPLTEKEYWNAMKEIEDNRIKISNEFAKRRKDRERDYLEKNKVYEVAKECTEIMMRYRKELYEDTFRHYMLDDNFGASLPIELGAILKNK